MITTQIRSVTSSGCTSDLRRNVQEINHAVRELAMRGVVPADSPRSLGELKRCRDLNRDVPLGMLMSGLQDMGAHVNRKRGWLARGMRRRRGLGGAQHAKFIHGIVVRQPEAAAAISRCVKNSRSCRITLCPGALSSTMGPHGWTMLILCRLLVVPLPLSPGVGSFQPRAHEVSGRRPRESSGRHP